MSDESKNRAKFDDNATIHFGKDKEGNPTGPKNNPKREGARCFEQFALYEEGMTIAEFLEKGGSRASVNWDVDKGYITVKQGKTKAKDTKKAA